MAPLEGRTITTFIGIDLAWQGDKNHSGLAAFHGSDTRIDSCDLSSSVSTLGEVCDFVARNESQNTVVAIDAPLIISNQSGQRPCETEVSRRFGKFHAGAHTSNLSLYPDAGGVRLAKSLLSRGYRHSPIPPSRPPPGLWFFEVYPHPAQVVLFERNRIIKYKKGPVAERRRGLAELRQEIEARIFGAASPFILDSRIEKFFSIEISELRGRSLKHHEDLLDSIFCAYLAFYLWRWSWERSEMIGDLDHGYIVVPKADAVTSHPARSSPPR